MVAAPGAREVDEELGLRRSPVAGLPACCGLRTCRRRTEGLVVVFDGGVIENPEEIRLRAEELSDSAFVEPVQLGSYLPALQTRRAVASLRARTSGQAVYLEDGLPLAT